MKIFNYVFHAVFLHQGIDFMISHGHNSQITLIRARNIEELTRCWQKLEERMNYSEDQKQEQEEVEVNKKGSKMAETDENNFMIQVNLKGYLCP